VSVGSVPCLLTVENVIGDSSETETMRMRGQDLERPEGADAHRQRLCYHGPVFELFLAFGQWLYLGKMEKVLTLCCIGNILVFFCWVPITEENTLFQKGWSEMVSSVAHGGLDSHKRFSGAESEGVALREQ